MHSFLRVVARAAFASVILLGFGPFASAAYAQHSASEAFSDSVEYCVSDATFKDVAEPEWYIESKGLTFIRRLPRNDGFNSRLYNTSDSRVTVIRTASIASDGTTEIKSCSVGVEGVFDSSVMETMTRIFSNHRYLPNEDQPPYYYNAENMQHTWLSKCLDGTIAIFPNAFMLYFSSRFDEPPSVYVNYCALHVTSPPGATP